MRQTKEGVRQTKEVPCRPTTPSWPLLRPATVAAATTTITATASAIADAASTMDISSASATGHRPRRSTADHWPPPPTTVDAVSTITIDALAAASTAATTASRPAAAPQGRRWCGPIHLNAPPARPLTCARSILVRADCTFAMWIVPNKICCS